MLDWAADNADALTRRWRAEISQYQDYFGKQFRIFCDSLHLSISDNPLMINFNQPQNINQRKRVDVCVLSVGYGTDRPSGSGHHLCDSYWEPDNLDRLDGEAQDLLISGTGDGALTDLFRVLLKDFALAEVIETIVEPYLSSGQLKQMRQVERSLKAGCKPKKMRKFYEGLRIPPVIDQLAKCLKMGPRVVLNGTDSSMFSPNACSANRMLLSQLRQVPSAFYYRQGYLDRDIDLGERVAVVIGQRLEFDRVVIRHGPTTGGLTRDFPDIGKTVDCTTSGIRRVYAEIDPLRVRHWTSGFFSSADLAILDQLIDKVAADASHPLPSR